MPSFGRALHVALTVRDMRVSADWYERVLGFDFVKEFQVAPGDAGIPPVGHTDSAGLPASLTISAAGAVALRDGPTLSAGVRAERPRLSGGAGTLRAVVDHIGVQVADVEAWARDLAVTLQRLQAR